MIDWTAEERAFIEANYPHYDNRALCGLVKLRFPRIRCTWKQIKNYGYAHGLRKAPGVRERAIMRSWGKE